MIVTKDMLLDKSTNQFVDMFIKSKINVKEFFKYIYDPTMVDGRRWDYTKPTKNEDRKK